MPAASESQVSFMQRRDWIKYELWKSLRKTQLHMEKKKAEISVADGILLQFQQASIWKC